VRLSSSSQSFENCTPNEIIQSFNADSHVKSENLALANATARMSPLPGITTPSPSDPSKFRLGLADNRHLSLRMFLLVIIAVSVISVVDLAVVSTAAKKDGRGERAKKSGPSKGNKSGKKGLKKSARASPKSKGGSKKSTPESEPQDPYTEPRDSVPSESDPGTSAPSENAVEPSAGDEESELTPEQLKKIEMDKKNEMYTKLREAEIAQEGWKERPDFYNEDGELMWGAGKLWSATEEDRTAQQVTVC
jgi:hypothetical protein